jgi:membrane protease YdiL (CAAX protease family)
VLTIVIVQKTDLSIFGFKTRRFGTALFYGLAFFLLLNALTLTIVYSLISVLTNQIALQAYDPVPFFLAMPFMTFCVGISEEGLFRGYMQTHLEKIYTPRKAILIQTLLFGFWHLVWDLSPFNP